MRGRLLALCLVAACRGGSTAPSDGKRDAPMLGPQGDAAVTYGSTFSFAVIGDTRPPNEDDVSGYPTGVITGIWHDVETFSPHPDFAVSTGDYVFANPNPQGTMTSTVDAQLDLYLGARAQFTNAVFAAMGNHECTGATASNCGPGNQFGLTPNYSEFMKRMLAPYGITKPYYAYEFAAGDGSWTAKLVVIAANAWDNGQSTWLDEELGHPTTYTFIVRHEGTTADTAPGVTPSEAIIAAHPFTLKIVGHTHTYAHDTKDHELICGNGGAPLTSGANYGYAILTRQPSGAIQVTEYDYSTNRAVDMWSVNPDGSPAS
jgi:hypothetical protein